MDLTQESVQSMVTRVHSWYLGQRLQIRQHRLWLILDLLRDAIKRLLRRRSHGWIIPSAIGHLHLVIVLYLLNDSGWDLLRLLSAILVHYVRGHTCWGGDVVHIPGCSIINILWGCGCTWRDPASLTATERVELVSTWCVLFLSFTEVLSSIGYASQFYSIDIVYAT